MDPCRIRSYLQVACAGLGFEIGEIWWTGNEHGSSTVAAIEEKPTESNGSNGDGTDGAEGERKLRFVQLYTSKSYENRRSMLVTPPEDEDETSLSAPPVHDHEHQHPNHECTTKDLERHKLSPRLVDAISKTAQVVWANTVKQEGLTGRSDIPLHTAVGMPVALDANGNMCVVVMFSPSNIQSTDSAMEYLQSISRSATSSSIPCLMPAFDNTENIQHVPTARKNAIKSRIMPQEASLGEGVTARFVSIDDGDDDNNSNCNSNRGPSTPEEMRGHDLASAPKDCFGIPMLPSFAELGNEKAHEHSHHPANHQTMGRSASPPGFEDVFDEASYGVWSTIMREQQPTIPMLTAAAATTAVTAADLANPFPTTQEEQPMPEPIDDGIPLGFNEGAGMHNLAITGMDSTDDDPTSLITTHQRRATLDPRRKDQLEEFCTAFLGMSVFDIADVWIPAEPEHPGCLTHVTTVTSSNQSNAITDFKRVSGYTLIKFWSGAVGRAYSSGNPVWSCNPDVYIDKGRSQVFERANIMTAFAVPICTGKRATPVGVVCCYSMIQSGSVPFVLRFVQQALHLLWSGLDKVEPHQSVGQQMWQDVGPADLGEMAADEEMQRHFISKKRPRSSMIDQDPQTAPLSAQLNNIDIHRNDQTQNVAPFSAPQDKANEVMPENYNFQHQQQLHLSQQTSVQAMQAFQNHIKDAVRQVGEAMPFSHSHVATTTDGSKRAHVAHQHTQKLKPRSKPAPLVQPAPLAMPHALPTHVIKSARHGGHFNEHGKRIDTQHVSAHIPAATSPQIPNNVSPQNFAQLQPTQTNPPQFTVQTNPPQYQYTQNAPAQPHPPHYAQNAPAQGLPPVENMAQPPAPSQLSQNLLSQGMLQSIANQQYQFSYEPGSAPNQNANAMPQYAAPTPPTSAGGAMPPSQQQQNGFCVPANTGYPAPDLPQSAPAAGSLMNGKSKGKLCRIQGCGDPSVVRRPYCVRHSGNRLCENEGCSKCAQGSTRFCIAHGGGRRCTFAGCDKGARDKFFCAAHGGGKRCKADDCNKSAVGGSQLCTAHGGGRRCAIDGCDKSAQSSTKFCVKHGGGKKCSQEGCEKVARGRTQYCASHGGGVRCKLDGCNRVAIGKMQLCRAHGGGSRANAKHSSSPPTPTGTAMFSNMNQSMQQTMEYPTATSV